MNVLRRSVMLASWSIMSYTGVERHVRVVAQLHRAVGRLGQRALDHVRRGVRAPHRPLDRLVEPAMSEVVRRIDADV